VVAVRSIAEARTSYLCSARSAAFIRSLLLCCPKQQQTFGRVPPNVGVTAMHIAIVNIYSIKGSWMITQIGST